MSKRGQRVETLVSIPDDVVLSPQAEGPPAPPGRDRSGQSGSVRELSWSELDRTLEVLAERVRRAYEVDEVVGLTHGGVFVGLTLAAALGRPLHAVRLSPGRADRAAPPHEPILDAIPEVLASRRVLVVDDLTDTGANLSRARERVERQGAAEVRTLAIVKRVGRFTPDFWVWEMDDVVVFPWDLDPLASEGRFEIARDRG